MGDKQQDGWDSTVDALSLVGHLERRRRRPEGVDRQVLQAQSQPEGRNTVGKSLYRRSEVSP